MSYKVQDNSKTFFAETEQKASIFLRTMAEKIVQLSEEKTPQKTGSLRRDVIKQVLGLRGKIIWSKNYAAIQEKKQFRNYSTPGTGPHFAENAIKEGVSQTANVAKDVGLI